MSKGIQKVGLLVFLAMSAMMSGFAQDDAQFTFFPWVTSYYNAGGIGEQSNTLCFTADYSNKYLGWGDLSTTAINNDTAVKTAPQDFLFSIESYLKKLHGSIGVTLVHDQLGFYKNTGVKIGYAYKLRVGGGHLGIGAQVSLYNQAIDVSGFNPTDPNDPYFQSLSESTLDMDFNFGVLYKTDQWYVGAGWTQMLAAFDTTQSIIRLSGDRGSHRSTQIYLHGGYTWVVPFNPNWEIIPQALVKTDLSKVQWEILALARYNGVFWGGLGYRYQDAITLAFGARPFYNSSNIYLKGLDVGVSYGFTANSLAFKPHRSFGDVEVVVRYCFDIYKPEVFSGYGNSRYIYKNRY
ncbi:MAG: PorP/SprF family type IX secretion system membrane protein [Bacteroidales bacterium]|jgi:type IX secretion system PorP/SprF family membrane protein|nr:PorP/SprF family type IX secretion system membrane protein [Bacteroidales bacterium]